MKVKWLIVRDGKQTVKHDTDKNGTINGKGELISGIIIKIMLFLAENWIMITWVCKDRWCWIGQYENHVSYSKSLWINTQTVL